MSKKPLANSRKPTAETDVQDDAIIGVAFKYSLLAICLLAAIVGIVVYFLNRPEKEAEAKVSKHKTLQPRRADQAKMPSVKFVEITAEAGIDFQHVNGAYGAKLMPETMGGGCAFLDYDNDGDQDLLFVNSNYWPWDKSKKSVVATMALYRNDGSGRFSDVTKQVGLNISFYGMGAAVGDYDNDGDVDIFFSALGTNRLFQNEGGEKFIERTAESGVGGEKNRWSTSSAFFDYDNDGLLDLYVCNYLDWSRENDESQGFTLEGVGRAYGAPKSFGGTMGYLYHNEGQGKFRDVSEDMGVRIVNRDTDVPVAKSMGVAPVDLDQDGWMDLIVANDTVRNFVFHNQGGKKFRELGELAGVAFDRDGRARGAMGIDAGDYRNNNTVGICIGNFANEMSALYVARRDPLQFIDTAITTGFGPPTRLSLTFGVFFFDYDLDGRLDILGSNGHLEDDINKVIPSQHHKQPPQLFWNAGLGRGTEFIQVPARDCGADFVKPLVGRGAAYADIDNDGDLDVVLIACGGKPRLLRNDQATKNRWLRVKLEGKNTNRDAIGAWVEVHLGQLVLRRQVMPSRSYLSQCELPATFGIGETDKIDKVVVRWPDGTRQEVKAPQPGKMTVKEE